MEIIIDSTEYKKDRGFNKENLSLIRILGKYKLIKLYIPWFVYKESSTSSIDDLHNELNTIKNKLLSLDRKGISNEDYNNAKKISVKIESLYQNASTSNEKLWNNFIEESNATLITFDPADSIKVFEAYFIGAKPFKSLKKRDDIPDAFIYESIVKLISNNNIHFVSGDNNLKEKCSEHKNICTYKSLEDFFNSESFKPIKEKYDKVLQEEKKEEKINLLIKYKGSFEDAVDRYLRNFDYLEVFETELPSDNGQVNIFSIDEPSVQILCDKINQIGSDFFIPIEVKAMAHIDFAVFKSDYWVYEYLPRPSEELNKHYYSIDDIVPVIMKKNIVINSEDIKEDIEPEIEIGEFDDIIIPNPYLNKHEDENRYYEEDPDSILKPDIFDNDLR